jgi:hypothetical protein
LLRHIEEAHPSAAAEARHIIDLYIALRYAQTADADSLPELRRAVRYFRF